MHGAGEQQQRYRYNARSDEQHHHPSTSSHQYQQQGARQMHQMHPIQATLMCTPTTTSAAASTSSSGGSNSSGGSGGHRQQGNILRIGNSIKIGDNILEPAGTLVFSQADGTPWTGQRIVVNGSTHAVVKANLFPIGTTPPVLNMQSNQNWYMNQPSGTVPMSSNAPATTSSATPDSGIQSVPTSPPSPSYAMMNDVDIGDHDDEEDDDGPADFTDMPLLKPVDEDDDCYDVPCTSEGPPPNNSNPAITTIPSSCSTPAPPKESLPTGMNVEEWGSFLIASNMDREEIVRRLMAHDPEMAKAIAMRIRELSAEESKKKKDMEAEVSSTTPTTPRARGTRTRNKCATRSTNSPDVTTSNLPEEPSTSTMGLVKENEDVEKVEGKRRGRKPKKRRGFHKESFEDLESDAKKSKAEQHEDHLPEASCSSRPESVIPPPVDPIQFRLKVREMMERKLEQLTQKMSEDMTELRLSHLTSSKMVNGERGKRRESFLRQLNEQSKKLRKGGMLGRKRLRMFMTESDILEENKDNIKKEVKEESTPPPTKLRGRLPSRRTREPSEIVNPEPVEKKFNGEYFEITKSVPSSDDIIPLWMAPSLTCGCTKGACTSDMDCLNRALRVQCSSDCSVPYCSNRRFWKEDCGNKLCVSNGPRSKRVLKTKIARRAGEFLCEYAGEVITREQAQEKFAQDRDPRIIAIAAHLFVDATKRSNIARFIKHSCKPNSRLEVWSVNGFYRAGVFALSDLNPNAEITVDKSDLLPFDMACNCGATECKRVIRGVRWRCADPNEKIVTRRFVIRNRRKTIERSSHSGLPAILQTPMDENSSIRLKMKQVLAAFAFRVRKIDGSMSRTMLPHYTLIIKFLKTKGNNPNPVEFVSLFRKWLEAIDDDDLERAFVAIESHYMSSSILSSSLQSKKAKDNAPRARALSTSCPSPVPSKRGDADLSYLESLYPIGSYDPDDAWESYSTNKKGNAVRCICGALDEEGTMVQCDTCHFWLHVDCCQYVVRSNEKAQKSKNPPSDDGEYICDFCTNKQNGLRPSADVKLTEQPDVRFENCDYYRSLINRRGIQVVLNETVYVNRVLPEDHKAMLRNLREEKKGSKQKDTNKYRFPKAATSPLPIEKVDRKNARIFRVERLFVCPGNNRFVFGSFYAWPHETYADAGRVFSKKEVFATPYYETLLLDEVIGRCLVLDTATWCKGRPKVPKFKEDDVFLCEMQIGKTQRVFEKVPPKNRYPINTNSYVFTEFTHPKKVVRDFRPYDPSNPSPKPPKTSSIPSTSSIDPPQSSSDGLPEVDTKKLSKRHIQRVLKRLVKNGSRRS